MTKTKKQLRAEAVERLVKLGEVGFYYEIIDALCDADCDDWSGDKVASTIRDLLTDDDANDDSVPESGVSDPKANVTPESCRQYADQRKQAVDADRESCDSRERLEADMREYFSHWMGGTSRTQAAIIGWLDRQAAITEREVRERIDKQTNDELPEGDALGWLRKWIAGHDPQLRGHGLAGLETIADVIERDYVRREEYERATRDAQTLYLKVEAERDKLREELRIEREAVEACIGCDKVDELTDERDNWKANCEDWKKHARAAENVCYETMLERDEYREKLSRALDLAHEIGRLQP